MMQYYPSSSINESNIFSKSDENLIVHMFRQIKKASVDFKDNLNYVFLLL